MGISSAPLYPLGVGVVLRPFLLPQTPAQIAATQAGRGAAARNPARYGGANLHPTRLGGGIGSGARLAGLPRRLALERGHARGHVGRIARGHCARFHPRGGGHRHGNALYDFAGGGHRPVAGGSAKRVRANDTRARTSYGREVPARASCGGEVPARASCGGEVPARASCGGEVPARAAWR